MPSNIEIDRDTCFRQVGRSRLFAQLFEEELRHEVVFNESSQIFWHDCSALLALAVMPLTSRIELSPNKPTGSDMAEDSSYLSFVLDEWTAARVEADPTGAMRCPAQEGKCEPVERLFGMLSHLRDARFGLKHWMKSIAEHPGTPECMAVPSGDDSALTVLERLWWLAEGALEGFRGDDQESDFLLHLIGRRIFLTVLVFAVVAPARFERNMHGRAVEHLETAVSRSKSEFYRKHLLHKLSLLKLLTPSGFEQMSRSPTDYPGDRPESL